MADEMPIGLDLAGLCHPDFKVVAAMAGCCVDKARTGIIGNVIAFQHGDGEIVAASQSLTSGWASEIDASSLAFHIAQLFEFQLWLFQSIRLPACQQRSVFRRAAARNRFPQQ